MSSPVLGVLYQSSPKWGQKTEIFGNFGLSESHLMANASKMVSLSITCQLELNFSLTTAF